MFNHENVDNGLRWIDATNLAPPIILTSLLLLSSAPNSKEGTPAPEGAEGGEVPSDIFDYLDKIDKDEDDFEDQGTVSFEVIPDRIELIQKQCIAMDYPLLAEYDFRFARDDSYFLSSVRFST